MFLEINDPIGVVLFTMIWPAKPQHQSWITEFFLDITVNDKIHIGLTQRLAEMHHVFCLTSINGVHLVAKHMNRLPNLGSTRNAVDNFGMHLAQMLPALCTPTVFLAASPSNWCSSSLSGSRTCSAFSVSNTVKVVEVVNLLDPLHRSALKHRQS